MPFFEFNNSCRFGFNSNLSNVSFSTGRYSGVFPAVQGRDKVCVDRFGHCDI